MNLKDRIICRLLDGEVSGEELATSLGVTRAAVWKAVQALRADGFEIDAASGKGYRLINSDVLSAAQINKYLRTPWTVETLKQTTSTNDVAKQKAADGADFYAVAADRQSAGRGRVGRSFSSPSGAGLYMSAVLRPHLSLEDCGKITAYAAVATYRAIWDVCGVKADIKWVNDLYYGGRKLCGILTEGSVGLEGGALEYAVVGIGVNTAKVDEKYRFSDIAVCLEEICGRKADRCALAAAILDRLYSMQSEIASGGFLETYRERNIVLGRTVKVNGQFEAKATAIDDDCSLVLDRNGQTLKFSAGEVSVKL